ncbi:MAG: carbohydrate ABC transporter permease [Candidatus Baldrarchaeia archaeon]
MNKKPKIGKLRRREEIEFYIFILPWLIGFIWFYVGPVISSILISFTEWSIFSKPTWIGINNYREIFHDPLFYKSMINTAYYTFTSVPLKTILSLIIAILLNQKLRGISIYRTCYFLPSVTAGVATAILFLWLFDPTYGLFNYFLSLLGISGPTWLGSIEWAMPALIIMSLWNIATNIIMYLAGLQSIPEHFYEAAELDGANRLQQFRFLTLPLISPTTFLVIVTSFIYSFQVFLQTYVMTNGGPGNATLTYVLYLYRNAFHWMRMGYASALSWILFIIILLLTLIQFKLSKHWVHYY